MSVTDEELRRVSRGNWEIMADTEAAALRYATNGEICNVHYLRAFVAAALSELYARRSGVAKPPKESQS